MAQISYCSKDVVTIQAAGDDLILQLEKPAIVRDEITLAQPQFAFAPGKLTDTGNPIRTPVGRAAMEGAINHHESRGII